MDTLTHALSGALLARATAARKQEIHSVPLWQRVAVGAVAAVFPDIDYVAFLVSPLAYLVNHRGVTHSLVLLPVWAMLLAWLAARAWRHPGGWRAFVGVAALGVGVHIAGDWITPFGTMLFAPLSDARFALGTTFIIDLWLTGIILSGLALSLAWKRSRAPAIAASVVLAGYVGFQGLLRAQAVEYGKQFAQSQRLEGARVSAQPGAVSPFNWTVVVEKNGEYRYAYVNLRRSEIAEEPGPDSNFFARLSAPYNPLSAAVWNRASLFGRIPEDAKLAREAWSQPEFRFFRWFAEHPVLYRVDRTNPTLCVWFYDLRFTRPGLERPVFRFGLCREQDGPWRRFQLAGDMERIALD